MGYNYATFKSVNIMKIEKNQIALKTGDTALIEYDREGDVLEIVFRQAGATRAIELTESIILRFNWESNEPYASRLACFAV